ncbi:helix-turn-helix transcriptional regulator [Ruegeria arenilitoris]|uniref:helix-turn-helix transcriptional regulator n=1 Tax=Ruegeria arenilitoris TaxID=1173585 RepID=UPI00147A9A74|nr:AlpA family phage regulatory protein [Ruegeria arenilitoris]
MKLDKDTKPWTNVPATGRLLRPNEVTRLTGLSKSQIYQMVKDGDFPPFIKVAKRASALPEAWLNAFVEGCAKTSQEVV